jgi:hypothetical protein
MWKWLKNFLSEYLPWTSVDLLIYTHSGRAFVLACGGVVVTAILRLWGAEPWRHDLLIAFAVCAVIAIASAALGMLFRERAKPKEAALSEPLAPIVTDGPEATVRAQYDGRRVLLFVTNQGSVASFRGSFDIDGPVNASSRTDLFCRWVHTDLQHTRIVKGETRQIVLAELKSDLGWSRWDIEHVTKTGPARIEAQYTYPAVTYPPIPDDHPIYLRGKIIADPDLVNGIQSFEVQLWMFHAKV